jgi:hypothetical protein
MNSVPRLPCPAFPPTQRSPRHGPSPRRRRLLGVVTSLIHSWKQNRASKFSTTAEHGISNPFSQIPVCTGLHAADVQEKAYTDDPVAPPRTSSDIFDSAGLVNPTTSQLVHPTGLQRASGWGFRPEGSPFAARLKRLGLELSFYQMPTGLDLLWCSHAYLAEKR